MGHPHIGALKHVRDLRDENTIADLLTYVNGHPPPRSVGDIEPPGAAVFNLSDFESVLSSPWNDLGSDDLRRGRGMAMVSREYLLKQAETCLRLARGTTDPYVSDQLRALAAEYQAKAQAAESPKDSDKDK